FVAVVEHACSDALSSALRPAETAERSRLARRSPSLLPRCAGHRGLFAAPTLGFGLLYAFIIVRAESSSGSTSHLIRRRTGSHARSRFALAERLRRKTDWIHPTRVPRPCDRLGRGAPTRDSASLCPLLHRFENAPIVGQRRAILAPGSADRSRQVACCSRWTASPVHASLSFRYTQVGGAPTFWAP